ncbi:MAG: trigger factor [Actinomycetota bacterium]
MQTTLEEVDKHKVKLTVEVTPDEVKPVLDLAYRHLAESVKVPGFRKGKVPRKIIDTHAGRGAVMQEFLEHALPSFYRDALREQDLAPISDPEFEDVDVSDLAAHGLRFSATVETRPRLTFVEADYTGISVERPPVAVSESDLDEQLEHLRDRFAELETAERPARPGDYIVADIRAYVHEEEIPEATGQDVLYEVGSGAIVPELDREIEGKRKGDIIKFNATLPDRFGDNAGREVAFQVLVKEVKAKHLPQLDDEFAKTASEFDTLEELKADIRKKLGMLKEVAADAALRDRVLQSLIDTVDVQLPDRLVDQETESRVRSASERAERQGTTLEAVLQASNIDELQFRSDARAHAIRAIKADLALEAVARGESIRVTDEELDETVAAIARDAGRKPEEVRRALEATGQIIAVAGDIIRSKALDVVVAHANVAGDDGFPETAEEPSPPTEGKEA